VCSSVLRQVIGAKADVNVRTKVCMCGVGWWIGWVFASHSILQCVTNTQPTLLCYTHQTILHNAAHIKSLYMNCNNMQHTMTLQQTIDTTATRKNIPQFHCNVAHRIIIHRDTLQQTAVLCNTLHCYCIHYLTPQHTVNTCNTLHHTTTYCNALQCTALLCYTLVNTATHCKYLQHNAP